MSTDTWTCSCGLTRPMTGSYGCPDCNDPRPDMANPEGYDYVGDPQPIDEDPLTADEYGLDDHPPVCDVGPGVGSVTMPTVEDIEDSRTDPSAPIYGSGDPGFGDVKRRHLLVLMPLVDRSDIKDLTIIHRLLDGDIRDAMAKAARKLDDTAAKYRVTGYDWDLNDIQYDMPQPRVLSATLVIERE